MSEPALTTTLASEIVTKCTNAMRSLSEILIDSTIQPSAALAAINAQLSLIVGQYEGASLEVDPNCVGLDSNGALQLQSVLEVDQQTGVVALKAANEQQMQLAMLAARWQRAVKAIMTCAVVLKGHGLTQLVAQGRSSILEALDADIPADRMEMLRADVAAIEAGEALIVALEQIQAKYGDKAVH